MTQFDCDEDGLEACGIRRTDRGGGYVTVLGMSPDEVEQAASALEQGADELDRSAAGLSSQLGTFQWLGQAAFAFADRWNGRHRPAMNSSARALREAAEMLRAEAGVQRHASEAGSAATGSANAKPRLDGVKVLEAEEVIRKALDTGGRGVTGSDLDKIKNALEDLPPAERAAVIARLTDEQLAVLRDQMQESTIKGGWTHTEQAAFFRMFEGQPEALKRLLGDDYPSLVATQVGQTAWSGMHAIADVMGRPQDGEILIRRYDDGRVLVYLPGIEDFDLLKPQDFEQPNDLDSPRDMRWADDSARAGGNPSETWENPYAVSVRLALEAAGVPEGANLVLAGHSFGAYTAMELAADETFNGLGGYHVDGVVAMAADVDWRMDDVAERGTPGVVINNLLDPAVGAERLLNRDVGESAPGWQQEFFQEGTLRDGHDSGYYADFVRSRETPSYLVGLEGSATEYRYEVNDMYR